MAQKLFTLQPSNRHQSLLLKDRSLWEKISPKLNRERVAQSWKEMDFHFEEIDKRATLRPDACTVYYPGVLAFRSTLLEKIFPSPCASLEFLPIHASGEEWTLLNCLKTTSGYDPNDSEVLRGESGEIFLIQKLAVADPSVQECEVFTIADSNRAQLIAVPSFVDRMKKGGIQGLSFREIGQLQ